MRIYHQANVISHLELSLYAMRWFRDTVLLSNSEIFLLIDGDIQLIQYQFV